MRPLPARSPALLRLLGRRPRRRTVLAVALAAVAGLVVHATTAEAARTVAALGPTTVVWVAEDDLAVGDVVDPDAVTPRTWPVAYVPVDALADAPEQATVRRPVAAGSVVVAADLGGDASGPAALVPPGWRAVALSRGQAQLPLAVGDRVDVVAAFDPGLAPPEPAAVIVADALVVAVDDATATVAVPARRVPAVATSLVVGIVTLALVP